MRALLLLGVLVASGYLALMLHATQGHFVAQSPDLYVVAQYARAMAEGHPFRYNPGEAPTSGSTSLLHTAVLAVAHAVGIRGEGLVAFAILLGVAFYLGSVILAHRVATRLAGEREGLLAGGLVVFGGPVVWSYLYGSDIALFLFLAVLVLDQWLALWQDGRALGYALAGSALALARPEGLPLALGLAGAGLLRPAASRRDRLLQWAPVAAGLGLVLLQRLVTGAWLGTSVADKSLLPNYGLVHAVDVAAKYGVDVVRGLLLGLYSSEAPIGVTAGQAAFMFPPLGLLLVLFVAARPPAGLAVAVRSWLLVVAAIFALVGPNMFMGVHFNRYLIWAFPGLLAFVAVGLGGVTRLLARDDGALDRALFRAVAGLFLLLGLLSTIHFGAVYAEMAAGTWRREIPTAEWIRRNLPRGVRIANLATSVEYLTGHRNLNLHGVTSPGFGGSRAVEKEVGYFEALAHLSPAERPDYILMPRSSLENSALLPLLVEGPPVYATASLADDFLLFKTRWDLLDRGARLHSSAARAAVASLDEVDRLNVGDVVDEEEHRYRVRSRRGDLVLGGFVEIDDYPGPEGPVTVADGGRVVLGDESFLVETVPGRDLVVVMRAHPRAEARALRAQGGLVAPLDIPTARMRVSAHGKEVARLELDNEPRWNEHVFRIPAQAITGRRTELHLEGQYTVFRYWFYQ